jgi:hypothetical protein
LFGVYAFRPETKGFIIRVGVGVGADFSRLAGGEVDLAASAAAARSATDFPAGDVSIVEDGGRVALDAVFDEVEAWGIGEAGGAVAAILGSAGAARFTRGAGGPTLSGGCA